MHRSRLRHGEASAAPRERGARPRRRSSDEADIHSRRTMYVRQGRTSSFLCRFPGQSDLLDWFIGFEGGGRAGRDRRIHTAGEGAPQGGSDSLRLVGV